LRTPRSLISVDVLPERYGLRMDVVPEKFGVAERREYVRGRGLNMTNAFSRAAWMCR
jgi:hypothetical protein